MGNKRVSAFANAGSKVSRATKKPKENGRATLRDSEKNQGGNLGTLKYVAGRAGLDFLRVGEGVVDAALVPVDLITGNVDRAKSRFMDSPVDEWRVDLEQDYNPGKGMQFVGNVAGGMGQSVGYGLISAIPYAGKPMMYSSIIEQGISSAAEKTGKVGLKEIGYGVTVGMIEGALESKLGSGVGAVKKIGSSILKKTGKNVVKTAAKAGGKTMLKSVLTETAKGAAGEFAEEAISEAVDPALLRLYNIDENAQFSLKDVAYAGVVGGISGGIMSAGPSAINYRSAVSAGRSIQEKKLTGDLLNRAKVTLSTLDASVAQTEGKIKPKPTDETETREARRERKAENRRVRALSKETRAIADKLRKNIAAYESMAADPKTASSDAAAAVLGELRGNLFLVGYAYEADVIEEVLMSASAEEKQAFVDEINALFKEQGQKHDYTVADFENNVDDIRRGLAGRLMVDEILGDTDEGGTEYGAEATETAEEAAQGTKETTAEEVAAQEENGATEATEAEAPDPWESVEGIEGFGTQNKQEEDLLRAASTWGVPKRTVPAMLKSFREGTDLTPAEFAEAWGDGVMFFGRLGLNESAIDKDSPLARTSENTRRASIQEGKTIADEELKRAKEKADKKKMPARNQADAKRKQEGRGAIVKGKGLIVQDLESAQYTAYKAAEMLAPVLGTDIVIETDLKTDTGKQINGFYSTKTNRMHININAKRDGQSIALYTLGHEVTHYIKEWSPEKFKALSDFVMEHLGNKAPDLIAAKAEFLRKMPDYKDYTVTQLNDLAAEEVVADSMELVLSDGKILDELAHTEKTVWQKIKDFITKIIADIRKYYGDLNQASKTAQVLKETVESLEEIERLFTEGVREAGERTRTAGVENTLEENREVIYSVSPNLGNELDLVLSGKFNASKNEVYLGETSNFLTDVIGAKALAHYMPASKAYSAMVTREEYEANPHYAEQEHYHGLGKKDFMEILEKSETPIIAFAAAPDEKGNKRRNRIVLVTDKKVLDVETGKMEYAVVVEEVDSMARKSNKLINANKAITVYPRSQLIQDIQNAIIDHRLLDTTKKGEHLFAGKRGSNSQATIRKDVLKKNIAYFWANVKWENEKNKNNSTQETQMPSAIRLALEKAGYIDQDGRIKDMQETDGSPTRKYSISEENSSDTAYLAAVKRNDMVTAQKMVDEAAKKAGYINLFYHGAKKGGGFTVFRDWSYFTKNKAYAERYTDREKPGSLYKTYVKMKTPFDTRNAKDRRLFAEIRDEYGLSEIQDTGLPDWTDGYDIADYIDENDLDYDGIILDEGGDLVDGIPISRGLSYVVRKSAQIKSADPVTYDDNGNVIPLSERFKEDNSDIRYSIDETPETPDVSENRDLTDREILGMALEGAVQSQEEYNIVKSYREQASMLELVREKRDGYIKEANALERQIKALRARMEDEGDPDGWIRKAMDDAIAKKREAERMRDEQVKILDNADRELLRMKAAKPFREIVDREQKRRRAEERRAERAEEVADRKVERARESAEKKIAKEKERMEEQSKKSKERKEITIRMREARRVLGYLNTMLYHPTKQKHVPESLQALVDKALRSADPKQFGINRDHIREMSELAGKIRNLESKAGRTTEEQKTLDAMKTKYEKLEADTISVKRQAEALMTAFEQYVTSTADGEQIDKNMLEGLRQTVTEIEEAPLNEMTLESLKAVEKIYTVIYHQVKTANQAFATEKAASIDEMSTEANTQVKKAKELKFLSPRSREWAALAGIRSFLWKNMKPLTVFEAIGSNKLMEIFRRVLDAEDVWITDILEAKKVLDEAKKEFGYNKWNLKERREITTADGSKVSLTLSEMMSLYAYMFREQAEQHLSVGGFVFAPDAKAIESFKGDKGKYRAHLNDQTTHRMRKEDIAKMSEMLTEEQRAYAKTVQEYLTSLGAKGNEVSRKLYGIDLFKETAYFPIKSSHDYIETSTGKSGDPNIKSRGTFKETVPKAGNPIVLEDFMEVVGNHVNTMATYHAFVLPVEDLTRVWNYTPVNIKRDADGKAILDENGMPVADTEGEAGYNSLKAEITKKYGKEANDYILQLLRDLNGGARRESAASILDKGLTAFKRSATMLSLSTIVQQPTSIIRAMAYVDAKHFAGASFVPWETVKKYAPVAAIKEVGGHDTNTGARTVDYINAKQYDSIKDAAKAAVTPEIYGGDPNVRAEAFGWLTGKADEVSWRYMFGAIVNEQAEKLGKAKDSEEVLKAAGKRFAEVVRHTQVYDSTLTRSEFMRSKDGLMKMATAFGAEPTTILSMAAEAIIKLERGDKAFFRKTAGAVAASILVNAVISSVIYAMRDDDEDKNLLEKYTESVVSEIIEGFNPLEYLPIARDVMSIFKGYDIERTDMSLISNLYQQIELLTSSKRSPADKIAGVSGAVGAFFGLPVTNVYRDAKGIVLTTAGILDPEPVTGRGMGNAVGQGIKGQTGLLGKIFGKERGDSYELYKAYVKGDKAHYDRVAARYKIEADLEYALRRELRENDKRIVEAAEAKHSGDLAVYESLVDQIEAEGIFDRNIVIRAINNEASELKRAAEKGELVPKDETATDEEETPESLYTASDLNAALERGDAEDFAAIMAALVEDKVSTGKTEAQAKASVKSSITAYWKKQYLSGYQDTETRKRIIAILTETGLYGNRNDVATMCEGWVKAYTKSK